MNHNGTLKYQLMTVCVVPLVQAGNNSFVKELLSLIFLHLFMKSFAHGFISVFASTCLCEESLSKMKYRHPSISTVNWFQKNGALSETALTELHRKVSAQKLKSAT
jgi:hypothetical protein